MIERSISTSCGRRIALLFYHPGVWWLSRHIRPERENAGDDLAVAACGDAVVQAEALANLEKLRMPVHIFALSADEGSLMQRVTRLITPHTPTRFGWKVPVAALAVLCCGASLASLASQVTPAMDHALADAIPTIASSANSGASSFGINGPFLGGWRSYSESVTPQGHVTETYTVNGHPARIDASARAWIASKYAAASHVLTPPPIPSPPPIPTQPPTPSLANQATGHWWQIAGTSFEIRAPFAGGQRVYKTSTSLSGDLRESYTVNDRPAPIDAGVRQWIRAAKLRQLPPMPPMPAMPPVPATPPVPPMPGTHS